MKNFHSSKRAFTLIELLLSILVLSLFITSVTSAFIRLASAQRDANKTRKIYSEAHTLMETLVNDVRGNHPDWFFYRDYVPDFENTSGAVAILVLVNKAGDKRVQYKDDNGQMQFLRQKYTGTGWVADGPTFAGGFVNYGTTNVTVEDVKFYISPRDDRLYEPNISWDGFHYQPKVTITIGFSAVSPDRPGAKIRFSLQTTASSRVY